MQRGTDGIRSRFRKLWQRPSVVPLLLQPGAAIAPGHGRSLAAQQRLAAMHRDGRYACTRYIGAWAPCELTGRCVRRGGMGAVRCAEAAGPVVSCDGHETPACARDDVTVTQKLYQGGSGSGLRGEPLVSSGCCSASCSPVEAPSTARILMYL